MYSFARMHFVKWLLISIMLHFIKWACTMMAVTPTPPPPPKRWLQQFGKSNLENANNMGTNEIAAELASRANKFTVILKPPSSVEFYYANLLPPRQWIFEWKSMNANSHDVRRCSQAPFSHTRKTTAVVQKGGRLFPHTGQDAPISRVNT